MNFTDFKFHPLVEAGITAAGYVTPTPIQNEALPPVLAGSDVMGLAQTGTGKTAVFVLPILQSLVRGRRGKLRALIISPTRELAEQTNEVIKSLGKRTGIKSVTIYGGVNPERQIRALRGGAEIAVACPGRLLDLMDQKVLSLSNIEILVLDEADQMFDMGFLPGIRKIVKATPVERQTLLFSATMPPEIRSLASDFLKNPVTIQVGETRPPETVSHAIYNVQQNHKTGMLLTLLDQTGNGQVLVFTRTKHRARKLAEQLAKNGISSTSLQGNLSQNQRDAAMLRFRSGRARVLVATDIAARGIDISMISHVVNFDMPDTAEAYTHRIGRTGRMENSGMALTFVTPEDTQMVRTIERMMGCKLERREMEGFDPKEYEAQAAARSATQNPVQQQTHHNNQRSNYPRRRFAPTAG